MKTIKQKICYFGIISVIGIVFLVVGNRMGNSNAYGFGSGLTVVGILKIIQYYRMTKDPEKMRKFEINQTEERLIFLGQKSAYLVLWTTLAAELCAMAALILMERDGEATVVSIVACVQTFLYLVVYWYYSKRY